MSNNLVYEITQKINDNESVQKDINDALTLVQNLFKERYLDKMSHVINAHTEVSKNNPPKEVQLMSVLKAFVPKEKHEMLNKASEILLLMSTMQNIQNDFQAVSIQNSKDSDYMSSIHADGVYEMDTECLTGTRTSVNNAAPLLMMMAFLNR